MSIVWTDAPTGSAAHLDGVLICQLRKLAIGGWSAGWRNGKKWDVSDQLTQVEKSSSRHFKRRDSAKSAVETEMKKDAK
ncbi:hypothetical protein [Polaromonas sp.]|uniref:hypothetical protein n=1 Tax=Polaromonas sp. TaxID=1869339 RepID=UPI00352A68CC